MRLLATGQTADVFDLGDGTVLRQYRNPDASTTAEHLVMRHLRAHGFPTPAVCESQGPALRLEHIPGTTLAAAALAGHLSGADVGEMLVDLQQRLPSVPPPAVDCLRLLPEHGPLSILHLDLHPANVILGPAGPVVVDWTNAALGPGQLDTALTTLILSEIVLTHPDSSSTTAALRHYLAGIEPLATATLKRAADLRRSDAALSPHQVELVDRAAHRLRHIANP